MYVEAANTRIRRILIFGDDFGTPISIAVIPSSLICGIVAAEIRAHQHLYLRGLAERLGVAFFIQPKYTSDAYPEFLEQVTKLKPDLIFVNSYSMLIRSEILDIPVFGAVNVHGALLPQYRGCNPTQWALLNNEVESGVTMHYMDADFDTGDIIAQKHVPIYFADTWNDIQGRIGKATETMLAEELPKLLDGTNARQPQDASKANYYHRRHPQDGLIDWQQSVIHIYNLIRALVKPHPGAFYYVGSEKVVLDEYLTLSQVTALKYGLAGRQNLQSERFILTPLKIEDLPALMNWINQPVHSSLHVPYEPIRQSRFGEWFDALQARNNVLIFGVRQVETGQLIGFCQLQDINFFHRFAEMQIFMNVMPGHGNGYPTDVSRLLLDFAFDNLELDRVHAYISAAAEKVITTYEEMGFVCEGLMRQAISINSAKTGIAVMGILREEHHAR